MTVRLLVAAATTAWVGATLLLSCTRALRRPRLRRRLQAYAPTAEAEPPGFAGVDSFREVLRPVLETLGASLTRSVGITEDLTVRLHRVHSPLEPTAFRMRQLLWGIVAFGIAGALGLVLPVPSLAALALLLGAPVLALLLAEQQLVRAGEQWQEQVFRELPTIAEQIGMLLASGWSLGTALEHVARRSSGACSRDLARVCRRIGHGLSEHDALREWAATVRVPVVDRLVSVLVLSHETSDLDRLVAEEARAARREAHRTLLENIERRTQQVWIPVTVATLVPGVLLLAVPFVHALRLFSTG